MKNSLGRRLAAIAGAGTVALAGLAAVGAANAAPISQLSSDATATVTFHKLTGNPNAASGQAGTSKELPSNPAGSFPVQGVQFTLTKIQCDGAAPNLDTKAGWDRIAGLGISVENAGEENEAVSLTGTTGCVESADVTTTGETGADGKFATTSVDHTVYVVREVKNEKIKLADNGMTKPFLLTVPYALADGGWNYDIHIYPKNQLDTGKGSKTPKPSTTTLALPNNASSNQDGTLDWEIKVPVPQKSSYQVFYIDDPLAAPLSYKEVSGKLKKAIGETESKVTFTAYLASSCTPGGTGTAEDPHTMTCTEPATAENSQGQTVRLLLDAATTKTLAPGDTLTVTLTTGVDYSKIGSGAGETATVENKNATFNLNNEADPTALDTDSDEKDPQVNYGTFNITKVNAVKADDKLKGAEFELYAVDTTNGTDTEVAADTNVKLVKVTTLDAAALTTVEGGKFKDDVKVILGKGDDVAETFYLKEVTAPDGFQTPTGKDAFTKVEFTSGTTTNPTIQNTQQKLDSNAGLPLTGAQGLLVLSLGGAALIGLGVFAVVVIRRRQQQED